VSVVCPSRAVHKNGPLRDGAALFVIPVSEPTEVGGFDAMTAVIDSDR